MPKRVLHQQKAGSRVKAGTARQVAKDRRLEFVCAYLSNGHNGTAAAITAGYSAKSAAVTASQLIKDREIQQLIASEAQKAAQKSELTVERAVREVARIAFFDIRKLFDDDGQLKPVSELDDDTAAGIASIEVVEERGRNGEVIGYTKKLKVCDKNSALEKAMKYLGLFVEKIEHSGTLTIEQIDAMRIASMERAVAKARIPK